MRIISKRKDYYDGVQRMGIDKSLTYVRKPEYFDGKRFPYLLLEDNIGLETPLLHFNIITLTIGFCGHVFIILRVTGEGKVRHFFELDDALEYIISRGKTRAIRGCLRKVVERRHEYRWRSSRDLTDKNLADFREKHKERDDNWFIKLGAPVFLIYKPDYKEIRAVKNPILKRAGFQKVKDPYTAFQELSMYLGGPLATQMDPNMDIDDETMAAMKGFNRESFRMDSPGKKRKRRKKR